MQAGSQRPARALTVTQVLAIACFITACSEQGSAEPVTLVPRPNTPPQQGADPVGATDDPGTGMTGAPTADTPAQDVPPADTTEPTTPPDDTTGAMDDGTAGDGASADPQPADPAPGPIDYGVPGPHEVLIVKNAGEAFRNDVADDTARCRSFLSAVGGSDSEVADELTSYPADMDRELYTIFRPAELQEGVRYPVITWGNGTCSHPLLFSELLEHLASHGFIVVATNTRWTGGGVEMLHAVDFILAEDENPDSPLFGKVDTAMVGACGHSQGSGATVTVGADPRIVATVPIQGASAAGVRSLQGPTFLIAGELDDLVSPSSVESAFGAATVPAVYGLSMGQDHLMPGVDPTPILDAVTAWFKIHLSDDPMARDLFYGDACTLCSDARWQIERRNL